MLDVLKKLSSDISSIRKKEPTNTPKSNSTVYLPSHHLPPHSALSTTATRDEEPYCNYNYSRVATPAPSIAPTYKSTKSDFPLFSRSIGGRRSIPTKKLKRRPPAEIAAKLPPRGNPIVEKNSSPNPGIGGEFGTNEKLRTDRERELWLDVQLDKSNLQSSSTIRKHAGSGNGFLSPEVTPNASTEAKKNKHSSFSLAGFRLFCGSSSSSKSASNSVSPNISTPVPVNTLQVPQLLSPTHCRNQSPDDNQRDTRNQSLRPSPLSIPHPSYAINEISGSRSPTPSLTISNTNSTYSTPSYRLSGAEETSSSSVSPSTPDSSLPGISPVVNKEFKRGSALSSTSASASCRSGFNSIASNSNSLSDSGSLKRLTDEIEAAIASTSGEIAVDTIQDVGKVQDSEMCSVGNEQDVLNDDDGDKDADETVTGHAPEPVHTEIKIQVEEVEDFIPAPYAPTPPHPAFEPVSSSITPAPSSLPTSEPVSSSITPASAAPPTRPPRKRPVSRGGGPPSSIRSEDLSFPTSESFHQRNGLHHKYSFSFGSESVPFSKNLGARKGSSLRPSSSHETRTLTEPQLELGSGMNPRDRLSTLRKARLSLRNDSPFPTQVASFSSTTASESGGMGKSFSSPPTMHSFPRATFLTRKLNSANSSPSGTPTASPATPEFNFPVTS